MMTRRLPATPAPGALEEYCRRFDALFGKLNQREAFRRYLEGLLLPAERHKTLTGIANTEPIVGAQSAPAQKLQWFLSESDWDWKAVNEQRLKLLFEDPVTAPNDRGVLVIDESGDRKWGSKTDHVGRQYIANLGKIDNGVVSVTSLWADEVVYWPVEYEPYTPAHWFERGKQDLKFRTKLRIAVELGHRAVEKNVPFRAVVADCFYGEDRGFRQGQGLDELGVSYVLALKPSHSWWHYGGTISRISALCGKRHGLGAGNRMRIPASGGRWNGVSATDIPSSGGRWRRSTGRTDPGSLCGRWLRRPIRRSFPSLARGTCLRTCLLPALSGPSRVA